MGSMIGPILANIGPLLSRLAISIAGSSIAKSIVGAAAKTGQAALNSIVPVLNFFKSVLVDAARTLSKFAEEVQKAQQLFGVNISASAKIQLDALESSINSIFNVFDQFLKNPNAGNVLNNVFTSFETAGKSILNDIKEGTLTPTKFLNITRDALTGAMKDAQKAAAQTSPEKTPVAISAEESVKSRATIQEQFGVIPIKEVSDAYAKFAKENGLSIEKLIEARRVFSTISMGDLSKTDQLRDNFIAQFKQQNISQKVALDLIVKNSEIFARNGLRFADSFVRASAEAKKIGVDLGKIDQIGDSIIGDFEGFLEKQAELGAMGFNFDSSRLAELAETGDTGALFTELRSQLAATGKDITKLRRSERLALEGAFGINISDMLKLAGDTPQEKTSEELLQDSNSILGQLLSVLQASKLLLDIMSVALSFTIIGYLAKFAATLDKLTLQENPTKPITDFFKNLIGTKGEGQSGGDMGRNIGVALGATLAGLGLAFTAPVSAPLGAAIGLSSMLLGGVTGQTIGGLWDVPGAGFSKEGVPKAGFSKEGVPKAGFSFPTVQKAAGGLVTGPGTDKSDSIPARLSNGEFIINAAAARKIGIEALYKINNGTVPKFKDGGSVGQISGQPDNTQVNKLLSKITGMFGGNAGKAVAKAQEVKTGGVEGLFAMAQNRFGNMFGGNAGKAVAKAQEVKAGGTGGLLSMAQNRFGNMFGGNAGKAMSGISNLFTGGAPSASNLMGMASKIPGVGGLLGKATGLLSGGGLKGMAGSLLGKVGLGSLGGSLLGGPATMLGSLAAPLLKKIPFIGGAASALAGGPGKLLGKLGGSALSKIGGLFGKKKGGMDLTNMLPPQMQAMLSGGQPGMEGVNFPAMLAQMMGGQQTQQVPAAPVVVDTKGMEEKLNNFIAALQGIQVHMDGTKVGKLLVNVNDAAATVGVFGAQSR